MGQGRGQTTLLLNAELKTNHDRHKNHCYPGRNYDSFHCCMKSLASLVSYWWHRYTNLLYIEFRKQNQTNWQKNTVRRGGFFKRMRVYN